MAASPSGPGPRWPKNGTPGIDPYARAMVARTGELPVGSGDGVAFYARTTMPARLLDGRCDVLSERRSRRRPGSGPSPCTIREGSLVANSLQRQGFTSQEIIRSADGSFEVTVGPRARPGNWLPTGGVESYRSGAAALRYADRDGDAHRARRARCPPSPRGRACDPPRALAAGRLAARRHRASCHRAGAAAHGDPGRLCPGVRDRSGQFRRRRSRLPHRRRRSCRSWIRPSRCRSAATICRADR